jgi:hypothetical protein
MSAIEASTVRAQTMADGTLRLTVDYPPASAQAAFRLFGAPGTPLATARIKTTPERQRDEAKPKGGALAKLAGQWCLDPAFQSFVRIAYAKHKGGDGKVWGDVMPDAVGGEGAYARHCILVLCGINSRAELDHNPSAAHKFHSLIREPFSTHLRGDTQKTGDPP